MADKMMIYKYIIKNVATKYNKTVTFMPKPLFGDNGSGMHTHISHLEGRRAAVCRQRLCRPERHGLVRHRRAAASTPPAILAFSCPTTNSYKRLVPGFEAPVNLAYSQRNRSAAIRIPMYSPSPKAKRLEFRCPDPSCNPYLSFSAMLMAVDRRHSEQDRSGRAVGQGHLRPVAGRADRTCRKAPGSLEAALAALRSDHEFLLRGDVFTPDVIDTWIWYKTVNEVQAMQLRPHPYEFCMYYDI